MIAINGEEKKIVIEIQSFDGRVVDDYALSITNIVSQNEGYIIGPIPLPIRDLQFVIHTSPNIDKKYRYSKNIGRTMHKRMMHIFVENKATEALLKGIAGLKLPSGVGIEIKA